ncbi:hypothetical protein Btru_060206 [Bulinus truncatus]|nr:hypothetical protein Btru_060206 [Bulinus truncatus]
MRCPEVCCSLSSLALAAFMLTLFIPRASLNKQKTSRSSEVDKMNKTLRDTMNTNMFLGKLLHAIKHSNGSNPPYVKRLPNDTAVTTRDNSNVITVPSPNVVRNVSGKDATRGPAPPIHPANVIYSESPVKPTLAKPTLVQPTRVKPTLDKPTLVKPTLVKFGLWLSLTTCVATRGRN